MIKKRLVKIFKDVFNYNIKNQEIDLVKNNVIDSFGVISLKTAIEKEFNIKIKDSNFEIKNFRNFNALIKFIKLSLKKKVIEYAKL
jgi:acyl carrier protein